MSKIKVLAVLVLLRTVKEKSAPGLSPWLVDGCLLPRLFTSSIFPLRG